MQLENLTLLLRSLTGFALLSVPMVGCATTAHDRDAPAATWRAASDARAPVAGRAPVRVYVVAFGLAPSVAARWSELETARAGFGVAQRIADALYESGSFTFLEEKAEVVARLDELLERQPADSAARTSLAEAGAPWLLYGEIVDLVTERAEIVRGLSGRGEVETRVTVQLRLVERASGRFHPATGTGASRAPSRSDTLDPVAVAEATNEAVGRAALALLERLRGDG